MSLSQVVCLVGTLYLFYLSWKILKVVLEVIKTTLLGDSIDLTSFGKWAVVTGCTDGIGKEYAKQLAAEGLNIVLMSRSKEKLHAVASEIEKGHKVRTKIIQVDFSGGHEIYEPIGKELEGLEIGVLGFKIKTPLVNNVGAGVDYLDYYDNLPVENTWSRVNINCMSVAMLTRMVIPSMVQRKKGVIVNVSSSTAVLPVPLFGIYPATKAFVDKFSESLHIEYADKGIIIQSVLPFFVATNMSGIKKADLFSPFPNTYVKSVLKKVGVDKRCFGYWPHELQAFIALSMPYWLLTKFGKNFSLSLREKGLKYRKEKKKS